MQNVSVIILTRDRLPRLRACLDALLPRLAPNDEALVIDTGSKDGTIDHFMTVPSGVRFFKWEGTGSWAEARNFGVQNARGECIAFLDDDCVPAPDWIERGRALLAESDAAGGLVEPGGISRWPEWWDARMGWLVGLTVPGHLGEYAGSYYYPYTSNLWIRAALARAEPFQELGGEFGADDGKRYLLGREDAEWWRRIRVKGHRTKFDPALRVAHFIEAERLKEDYLFGRARRDGEAWAWREGSAEDLEPVAYQTWRWSHDDSRDEEGDEAGGTPLYRKLMAARNKAALRALADKLAKADPHGPSATLIRISASQRAWRRFIFDRARTMARRVDLAFSPTPAWRPPTARPDRLVVAAFGHVGDLVILQSFLRGLIVKYPELSLDLITSGYQGTTAILFPLMRLGPPGRIVLHTVAIRTSLRKVAIVAPYLHGGIGPEFISMAHAFKRHGTQIISFDRDTGLTRKLHMARIQKTIRKDMTIHETENLRRLFGLGTDPPTFDAEPLPAELATDAEALKRVNEWRSALPAEARDRRILVLNPDAAYRQKEWPEESWGELVEGLLASTDHLLALNLSRAPHPLAALLAKKFPSNPRVVPLPQWPLADLIALISVSCGVITVDSAPQHLAHALNVPSLTLYGPMDERRWADRWKRPIHRTIRGGMFDLTAEELRGLPENHLMRLIQPAQALNAVTEWLGAL